MRRINLVSRHLDSWILRQTPGRTGIWGDFAFEINARGGEFDGVVAYDDFRDPIDVKCPPETVMFVTGEPPGIKTYHPQFLSQFHSVMTPHSDIPHPRLIDSHCGMPWHIGLSFAGDAPSINLDYDALTVARPVKTKLLSIIASHRNVTPAHRQRPALVDALRQHFGEDISVFGREYQPLADKWEAIAPFRYHVALENSRFSNYWTEKLSDSFLGGAFPLYWGSPDAAGSFPPGSFGTINIFDVDAAVRSVKHAIASNAFENSAAAREEARQSVLLRHNFFAVLDAALGKTTPGPHQALTLQPESTFRDSWPRRVRKRLQRAVPRALRPRRWKI